MVLRIFRIADDRRRTKHLLIGMIAKRGIAVELLRRRGLTPDGVVDKVVQLIVAED